MRDNNQKASNKIGAFLWTLQTLLTLGFLVAGGSKLVLPISTLTQQTPLFPGFVLRFVGVLELLGAAGLILPGLLRLRPELTPLAAAGLILIMCGATGVTLATGPVQGALAPVIVGFVLLFVGIGRWKVPARSVKHVARPTVVRAAA